MSCMNTALPVDVGCAVRTITAKYEWALSLYLIITITISSAFAQDTTNAVSTRDRRDNINDLPAGVQPWWPSRYGADDQLGTLNEITAATVRAASSLVKQGRVIDLGRTLDENTPKFPGRYWHQSVDVSAHFTNLRRADTGGKGWGKNEINWITEIQAGTFQVGTQLDSIGHIQIGDRFYNGWSTGDVVESWGLNRFGMEAVRWLYAQRISITGADTWSYGPVPGKDPERPFLVPQTMYVTMGLFGLENLATERLARRRIYEFMFALTHAKTRGSAAAVIAPAAIY